MEPNQRIQKIKTLIIEPHMNSEAIRKQFQKLGEKQYEIEMTNFIINEQIK